MSRLGRAGPCPGLPPRPGPGFRGRAAAVTVAEHGRRDSRRGQLR